MNIFITGSETLSEHDRKDIRLYLKNYATKHKIHVMCYRSLEKEVLKFFVEHDNLAENLSIYSFQHKNKLDESIRESIDFLIAQGSAYKSFKFEEEVVLRTQFFEIWETLLKESADLVVCFFNKDKPSAVIPLDIAKSLDIDAMYYELPGERKELLKRKMEDKIKVI